MPRIVSRFSCGVASAVATKFILSEYPPEQVTIYRAWIKEEHEDNDRFALDCEKWFNHPIHTVWNKKYQGSVIEVFRVNRYVGNGQMAAPCSRELKRIPLEAVSRPDDIMVLGYTYEEQDRADRFIDANNGRKILCPLIDRRLTKANCLAIVERAGIELPAMYKLRYNNNNCKCCIKGGMGYMNRQRKDFPEAFENLCQIQDILGPGSYIYRNRTTGERFSLRNLPPNAGRHNEPEISCGTHCLMQEGDLDDYK